MTVVIEQVPWPMWTALAVAVLVAGLLAGRRLDARHPLVPFALGLLAGSLLATTLHMASRPAPVPATIRDERTVIEQGSRLPAAPERTAAPVVPVAAVSASPKANGNGPAPTGAAPDPIPSGALDLRGIASWYPASGRVAAAGPALRRALGPGWRGELVRVCSRRHPGRCVRVTIRGWCQCYRGTRRERVIDLSASAFRRLAPLSAGLVRVTIAR